MSMSFMIAKDYDLVSMRKSENPISEIFNSLTKMGKITTMNKIVSCWNGELSVFLMSIRNSYNSLNFINLRNWWFCNQGLNCRRLDRFLLNLFEMVPQ